MPYRRARSYVKKRKGGKVRRTTKRRLQSKSSLIPSKNEVLTAAALAAINAGYNKYKSSRGMSTRTKKLYSGRKYGPGPTGKGRPDAASGGVGGYRVGAHRRMGTILARRKKRIMNAIADSRFPVIKDHRLIACDQIDWGSGTQAVAYYNVGYLTTEIQDMLTQANSAQTVATSAIIVPAVGSLTNQRMDIYDKTVKTNLKNTSSHTVHLEIQAFNATSYHSSNIIPSWQAALAADNMNQNAASFGTEETIYDIGKRPDFRFPDLNCRWKRQPNATFRITLEPGQETHYTYVQKGGRFDQQKFNVLTGNTSTGQDSLYMPGFCSQIIIFARAEMIADAADTDVTFGSGHIAVNREEWKSWSAVPYIKPYQTSFQNQWGSALEANELDMNQYTANNDPYEEQV